jgi:hypothetical protein
VPSGYVNDIGLVFADRGNGFSYGWNLDTTTNARNRDNPTAPDELHDSFIHMQKPGNTDASWQIGLPNGSYSVHLVAGDIDNNYDAVYAINVQGALAVSGTPTSSNKFFEGTVTVNVTNGLLTVSNSTGSANNKIDFIDISQVPAPGGHYATGPYLHGAEPFSVGSVDLTGSGLDLYSGHVFQVHLADDGTIFSVTIVGSSTGASASKSNTVDIPDALGGPLANAGFTGGTGTQTAAQDILDLSFSPLFFVGVS